MNNIPQLPTTQDDWSPALIGRFCGVPERTVRRWCRSRFPRRQGDWRLTHGEAQEVVNRMFAFGYKKKWPSTGREVAAPVTMPLGGG